MNKKTCELGAVIESEGVSGRLVGAGKLPATQPVGGATFLLTKEKAPALASAFLAYQFNGS